MTNSGGKYFPLLQHPSGKGEKGILLIAELVKWGEDSIASLQPVLLEVSKSISLLSIGSPAIHGAARSTWNNLVNVQWRPNWKLLLLHQTKNSGVTGRKNTGTPELEFPFSAMPCTSYLTCVPGFSVCKVGTACLQSVLRLFWYLQVTLTALSRRKLDDLQWSLPTSPVLWCCETQGCSPSLVI